MPIYEYECRKCGDIIEVIQGFNDDPIRKHVECGGKLERIISLSAFHLKGSGWYETDYGKKKAKSGDPKPKKQAANDTNGSTQSSKSESTAAKTIESIKQDTKKAKSK